MNPLIWSMLIAGLATSTIITMASHHWLLAWLGLELNTLSIMPIIMKTQHPRATEATTKYFIIQATAATMILFASTLNTWQTGQWSIANSSPTTTLLTTTAIMLKLGLAPVHIWYPQVLQGTTMYTALTMSTWQKLAPMSLLYMTHNHLNPPTLLLIGLISSLIGGWGGLNQTQTRTIMAFSSIAHMGWLITALTISPSLTTLTMLIYIVMTTAMFTPLATTNAKTIADIGTTWPASPTTLTMMMITLMSLGGLPPLTGFMPKWLILKDLVTDNMTLLATLLLLSSLPSLFFYIRLAYMTMLTVPPNTAPIKHQWRFKPNHPSYMTPMITTTIMLLPLTPILHNTT
uniref:NADH-ubiquinone oxidoreductase chain 2 n=3 Tax=Cyrtodactylus TaxID=96732 RepID=J9Y3C2_9SAUR|nr:NADH dehydrogenase subunit 2 [Cyrtodactylus chrysopylos]AZZ89592.1 NADH dehydrogenase subunit 2 [Cyrtodactylus myaleiktaung]AZZ89597.1 NADH dehydrogenase subunit 2 [Cyrtodactylus chrysopylos]